MRIKAENLVKIDQALSEIIGRICRFCQFTNTSTEVIKRFFGFTELNLTKFVHDVATFNMLLSCPSVFRYFNPIFFRWQCDNKDSSAKKRQFFVLNWLPWQRPLSDRQTNAGFIKPLHSSTKPENFVKICLVALKI